MNWIQELDLGKGKVKGRRGYSEERGERWGFIGKGK